MRSRWTTGGGGGRSGCRDIRSASDRSQRQHLPPGRADLDLCAERGADAAVVAGGPAAVVDLDRAQRVLPVLPHPVLVETGVEVVPRQDLGLLALTRGVTVEAHRSLGEHLSAGLLPPLEREVLAPPVEAATVAPHLLDDRADSSIAAGQQS